MVDGNTIMVELFATDSRRFFIECGKIAEREREKERKSFFRTIDFAYIATERGTRRNEIVDREKERGRERENGTKGGKRKIERRAVAR